VLANTKKKEAVLAVSQFVDACMVVSFRVAPVITPELIERIYTFKAGAPDVDDVTARYSLFLLTTSSLEATRALATNSRLDWMDKTLAGCRSSYAWICATRNTSDHSLL
jgi:hypothetical protein